jgi:hypothetical protein
MTAFGLRLMPWVRVIQKIIIIYTVRFKLEANFRESRGLALYRPPPHQDLGRARETKAGGRFARDNKELGPQLGEAITRRTASRNCRDVTQDPSAQLECSEERRRSNQRRRRADRTQQKRLCAVRLLTLFANLEYKQD